MTIVTRRHRRRRSSQALQHLHRVGTCPACRGTGTAPVPHLGIALVLPCGSCGGSGSSR